MTSISATIRYEVLISGSWENITADVIETQTASYGIFGLSPQDRTASSGILEFVLRNDAGCIGGVDGYYSPYKTSSKPGWRVGLPVRLIFTYDEEEYVKFRGFISNIEPKSGDNREHTADITVSDWMEYAARQPIVLPQLQENKKIEDVVAAIVDTMPVAPQVEEYSSGVDTFSFIFDTVKETTKALSEFNKVSLSEMGYIYIKRDKYYGETLVVEGRFKRNYDAELPYLPISTYLSGFLLQEDGDYLLQETGDLIVLNEVETFIFDNTMTNLDVEYGTNLLNFVSIKAYPRRIDTSNVVLYSMANEIELSAGETKTFVGRFRDPSYEAQKVSGKDMVTPVAYTDYTMYANTGGGGADLTGDLSVTANYGTDGVQYVLENTGASNGYINLLQARGLGIYFYDYVESFAEDTSSQAIYGYSSITIDQKYQDLPDISSSIAEVIVNQESSPREVPTKVKFIANTNDDLMRAFLNFDVGTMIYVKENQTGIDNYFYIHGVEFEIQQCGLIAFSWSIKEKLSLSDVYWILGDATYGILGSTTILGY